MAWLDDWNGWTISLLIIGVCVGFALTITLLRRRSGRDMPRGFHPLVRLVRQVVGWFLIIFGLFWFLFPIPLGLPLIVAGTLMVGTRSRVIRVSYVILRRVLRRWARLRVPLVGWVGRQVLLFQKTIARETRRLLRERAARRQKRQDMSL